MVGEEPEQNGRIGTGEGNSEFSNSVGQDSQVETTSEVRSSSQKMGKKSRVKTQKSGTGATASVSPKETLNLTSELLQKCSSPAPGPGKEWEEYVQIRSLVEKIRKKQKGLSVTFDGKREDYFPNLMKWASENGASVEGFEMVNFKEEGFGLRATRDIKAEELFLWVPRKLLMTVESAKNSVLGPLYSQDRILQAMGNITLAFHLLCERADPNSFWQPYIQTLPSEYDTPLYFEEDEVRSLQSTQAVHDVFSQYKNTARQYAYFYKVIQKAGLCLALQAICVPAPGLPAGRFFQLPEGKLLLSTFVSAVQRPWPWSGLDQFQGLPSFIWLQGFVIFSGFSSDVTS
ncbi:Histone-lysine N-methyltransferase setd3 [Myotis brandtii]|uniref:protein-histidine N-methyltransferase n=1 Tax=Myotis brandtii TaxID=109478 RepID=S7NCX3_MYOBR|nr:Histone-lysine N-methyltransferase setd3 [Myotis brandtii]